MFYRHTCHPQERWSVEHWIHRRDCCNKTRKPERVPCRAHQCVGWFWELVWHCIRRERSLFGEGWGALATNEWNRADLCNKKGGEASALLGVSTEVGGGMWDGYLVGCGAGICNRGGNGHGVGVFVDVDWKVRVDEKWGCGGLLFLVNYFRPSWTYTKYTRKQGVCRRLTG